MCFFERSPGLGGSGFAVLPPPAPSRGPRGGRTTAANQLPPCPVASAASPAFFWKYPCGRALALTPPHTSPTQESKAGLGDPRKYVEFCTRQPDTGATRQEFDQQPLPFRERPPLPLSLPCCHDAPVSKGNRLTDPWSNFFLSSSHPAPLHPF